EMIVGIYGIIKAGGAYVPVDPTYPEDRIRFMLEDAKPKAVLTYRATVNTDVPVLDLADSELYVGSSENPERVNEPEDTIYCIYTSGTTGRPKGVPNRNRGLINRITWMHGRYPLEETDVILQKTTFTFDVSVWEIIWWSIVGAKVIMLRPGSEKSPEDIRDAIGRYGVTHMHFVPSMLNMFLLDLEYNGGAEKLQSLKYVFASGEALSTDHLRSFNELIRSKNPVTRLINFYGPTEASIDVTYFDCEYDYTVLPIGKPINNTQIHIVQGDSFCGIGVPGELCIAGEGLAKGYLNRPELTAEKFVKNPYGEGRMYHTGDLARWMPDGNIEYLGRIDDQVKIRGFRIELGEIESRIRELEIVKDCAVIVRTDASGEKAVYAYIVSDEKINISDIRDELAKSVPEYMIPSYLMQIEAIPVTRNGKLDRRALPEIEASTGNEYIAPRNETEAAICSAFEALLGVEKIGVRDSFFDLGGDSIKAIRVVSNMRTRGYTVSVKDILNRRTPENIALYVTRKEVDSYEQGEVTGIVTETPFMRVFKNSQFQKPWHYNQSYMLGVDADPEVIRKALDELVRHHDILRAVYANDTLEILSYERSKKYELTEYDVRGHENIEEEVCDLCTDIQASIDLANGPLMKAAVFDTDYGRYLMICIHHLAVDGVSWRILLEDFNTLIDGYKNNRTAKLPDKTA
ncbi:MAG: amino acid adenylation domain-containing protein, partial [Lachnospiraceae bacterium]|nr:amino acid adenylation domain-containing protein [Lachnospiraceae bacterium]